MERQVSSVLSADKLSQTRFDLKLQSVQEPSEGALAQVEWGAQTPTSAGCPAAAQAAGHRDQNTQGRDEQAQDHRTLRVPMLQTRGSPLEGEPGPMPTAHIR